MAAAAGDRVPEAVRASLASFDEKLEGIEERLRKLFAVPLDDVMHSLNPIQAAKFLVSLAYSVDTLFYCYIKLRGEPAAGHPIQQELERVRQYMRKTDMYTDDGAERKPTLRVNTSAAARIIAHGLGGRAATRRRQGGGGGLPTLRAAGAAGRAPPHPSPQHIFFDANGDQHPTRNAADAAPVVVQDPPRPGPVDSRQHAADYFSGGSRGIPSSSSSGSGSGGGGGGGAGSAPGPGESAGPASSSGPADGVGSGPGSDSTLPPGMPAAGPPRARAAVGHGARGGAALAAGPISDAGSGADEASDAASGGGRDSGSGSAPGGAPAPVPGGARKRGRSAKRQRKHPKKNKRRR